MPWVEWQIPKTRQKPDDEKADDPETEPEFSDTPFSQDELMKKWNQFAESLKEERPRISFTLKSRKPELRSDYRIDVIMDNTAQLEDFDQNVKQDLHRFLRRELGNSLVQVMPRLEGSEQVQKKIYTSEDKFRFMNNKNPNLNKLKQQFNLELE